MKEEKVIKKIKKIVDVTGCKEPTFENSIYFYGKIKDIVEDYFESKEK